MVKLFNEGKIDAYFKGKKKSVRECIEKISKKEILESDEKEIRKNLFDRFEIKKFDIDGDIVKGAPEEIEKPIGECLNELKVIGIMEYCHKYPNANPHSRIKVTKIKWNIPFKGESDILKIPPNLPVRNNIRDVNAEVTNSKIVIPYFYKADGTFTQKEQEGIIEKLKEKKEGDLYYIKEMMNKHNSEIDKFNNELRGIIKSSVKKRKEDFRVENDIASSF